VTALGVDSQTHIEFCDVDMSFAGRVVFRGLSCRFHRGRITVLLGGSGMGKTTILRLIGGLVRPRSGRIDVAGEDVGALSEADLYRVRDRLGMMFQGGALLNSLTVFDNLAFPLREHTTLAEPRIATEVRSRLEEVGLPDVEGLLPGQLSGGMLKRAALARAIVTRPEILLCDEPFSGLDPISVKRVEALLRRINRRLGITMLISSHHIPSTMRLADQVILLRPDGVVTGSPRQLRDSADPSVAGFFNEEIEDAEIPAAEVERPPGTPATAEGGAW